MSNTLVGHSYALFTIYLSGEPGFTPLLVKLSTSVR